MRRKAGPDTFRRLSTREVFKINCERIKKGSKVGSRVSNHNKSPVLDASKVCVGNTSRKQNKNVRINKGKIRFNQVPACDFVQYMSLF